MNESCSAHGWPAAAMVGRCGMQTPVPSVLTRNLPSAVVGTQLAGEVPTFAQVFLVVSNTLHFFMQTPRTAFWSSSR